MNSSENDIRDSNDTAIIIVSEERMSGGLLKLGAAYRAWSIEIRRGHPKLDSMIVN